MKNQSGVTIIEFLISILVFSVGITAALQGFTIGNRWAKSLSHRTSAVNLAKAKMEENLSLPYGSIAAGNQEDYPLIDKGKISTDFDDLSGVRQVTVTQLAGCKEITVTVTWSVGTRTYQEQLVSATYP